MKRQCQTVRGTVKILINGKQKNEAMFQFIIILVRRSIYVI